MGQQYRPGDLGGSVGSIPIGGFNSSSPKKIIDASNPANQVSNRRQTKSRASVRPKKPPIPLFFQPRPEHTFMKIMLDRHRHEISMRPTNQRIEVQVLVRIESISEISEVNMDLTVTMTIRQVWEDYRFDLTAQGLDFIIVPPMLARQIWIPDLFIEGSKKSFAHITTVENTVMRISGKGVVDYTTKITSTMICEMALRYF